MQGPPPALRVEGITRIYRSADAELRVLDGVRFEVFPGESVALTGESGSGKTTLLHIVGGLDRPSSGAVWINGTELGSLSGDALADFRNRHLGFVWQQSSLLPEFTALENVAMPLLMRGERLDRAEAEARRWLNETGLAERGHHRTGELSGGEQQRVALARALVTQPAVLLADEPTGNLDTQSGDRIITLLEQLQRRYRLTSVIVTHSPALASRCSRQIRLEAGHAVELPAANAGENFRPPAAGGESQGGDFAARG